jgi:hypothetical protein
MAAFSSHKATTASMLGGYVSYILLQDGSNFFTPLLSPVCAILASQKEPG